MRLVGGFRRQLELEILALAHVPNARIAHRVQRVGDGMALRVEHGRFQGHEYAGFHFFLCAGAWPSPRLRPSSPKRGLHCSATRRRPTSSAYQPSLMLGPLVSRMVPLSQRVVGGLAFARLRPGYAGIGANTRSKIVSTLRSWSFRSNAFSTSAAVNTFITSASASSSALKSFCSWNERMALRCTHS